MSISYQASSAEIDDGAAAAPVLHLDNVAKHYAVRPGGNPFGRKQALRAVDGVSLSVAPGETFALIGESGSGKSTLGRLAVRMEAPTSGAVHFNGRDITSVRGGQLRRLRRDMAVVFQDPLASLNPRMTVGAIIAEPLAVHLGLTGSAADDRVRELLDTVGLSGVAPDTYPARLSGGMRQRVGIARAISCSPKMILADEAVSALDVSVQAQIVNLLADLREEMGLSILFIAHGLPVVRHIAHRVGVLYVGRMVETGTADELIETPRHPYTKALLASAPDPRAALSMSPKAVLSGEPPSPMSAPSGCRFRTRCPIATGECAATMPPLVSISPTHAVECHHAA